MTERTAEEDERERFDHAADRARGDGLRHRRERPAPRGRHEPDHGDAGDRHDGQETDVDADHRPERRREAAGGQPDRECEPGDRGQERPPAWHPGHDDDQRAERREAEVEADEPERVAHEPVRRPSQTPSSSPIGSKLRRTAGGGGAEHHHRVGDLQASDGDRRVEVVAREEPVEAALVPIDLRAVDEREPRAVVERAPERAKRLRLVAGGLRRIRVLGEHGRTTVVQALGLAHRREGADRDDHGEGDDDGGERHPFDPRRAARAAEVA